VGEGAVADIVEEGRGNDQPSLVIGKLEPATCHVCKVHGPEGMLEPGMVGTRIDKERKPELSDIAEALECGGIHDPPGKILDLDVTMDRVLDDLQGH
jgi:hypothetical protein